MGRIDLANKEVDGRRLTDLGAGSLWMGGLLNDLTDASRRRGRSSKPTLWGTPWLPGMENEMENGTEMQRRNEVFQRGMPSTLEYLDLSTEYSLNFNFLRPVDCDCDCDEFLNLPSPSDFLMSL